MRHRYVQDFREEVRRVLLIEPKKVALRIAALAKAKKAQKLVILDIGKLSGFCDYFIILSGESLRQVNAFTQAITQELEKDGIKPLSKVSANDESGWVVLDYLFVVVHIFYKPLREFYSLERLWSEAKRLRIPSKLTA